MRCSVVVLLLALFAGLGAKAQDGAEFYSYYSGKKFTFEVTQKLLEGTPDWDETDGNPPLSARRALEAAKSFLPKIIPNPEAWASQEIRLHPVGGKKWVYLVDFFEQNLGLHSIFPIVVLMNGDVVQPKITQQSPS